jgi:hypothetical protein
MDSVGLSGLAGLLELLSVFRDYLTWDGVLKAATGLAALGAAGAVMWRIVGPIAALIHSDRIALTTVPQLRVDLERLRMDLQRHETRDDERFAGLEKRVDERIDALERRLDERLSSQDNVLARVDTNLEWLMRERGWPGNSQRPPRVTR